MNKTELEERTKKFAIQIVIFVSVLPKTRINDVLGYQILKSGTSIGANYREANRAESRKDFLHKISIISKEAAETHYWLELFTESSEELNLRNRRFQILNTQCSEMLPVLLKESCELLAIFTSIGRTMKNPKS